MKFAKKSQIFYEIFSEWTIGVRLIVLYYGKKRIFCVENRRKFNGIKFYRKAATYIPANPSGTGLYCINDQWMVACVAINGVEVKCASADIYEFEKMLQKSGKYQPFTDPD
ncbi:MAG: hypothetical protein J6C40_05875 [Lentisphaeria bacterium]|nr:hypothetical protein [Lentisphaeria bacterium]